MNLLFMSSGNGSNLKLFKRMLDVDSSLKIKLIGLISDRECGAIEFARKNGIETWIVNDFKEKKLAALLSAINFDICFTGIFQIIPKAILDMHASRLRNIHYSLLPKYSGTIGMNATKMAILNGDPKVGATSHLLIEKVDKGPIINQGFLYVNKLSPFEIENLVFKAGFILHYDALGECFVKEQSKISNEVSICNHRIYFKKPVKVPEIFMVNEFWNLD